MAEFFDKETNLLSDSQDLAHFEVSPKNTFIVIDWDDTLLPTSWLTRNKLTLDTPFLSQSNLDQLEALDAAASGLIRQASFLYGHVLIITNAQQGWVELSSRKFLPETHELIFSNDDDSSNSSCNSFSSSSFDSNENNNSLSSEVGEKRMLNGMSKKMSLMGESTKKEEDEEFDFSGKISVISARNLFEKDFPDDPSAWKMKCFDKLLKSRINNKFFKEQSLKMIRSKSFSDSEIELNANNSINSSKRLKRRNSDLSNLSSLDLSGLIEEDGGYEVETDFDENDSFFSIDFKVCPKGDSNEEFLSSDEEVEEKDEEVLILNKQECVNLISIGDCSHDCESLRNADLEIDNLLKKTIKFIEFPSVEALTSELNTLQLYLSKVINLKNNSHLVVKRSYLH